MRSRATAGAVLAAIAAAVLVNAPAAHATTMTLKGVAVDKTGMVEAAEWNAPDGGGSASREDGGSPSTYTATYAFPVSTAIGADGASFTVTVTAAARKNGADQHTRFVPALTVSGSVVTGGSVSVSADANSETKPGDSASATVTLKPVAGSSVVTVGIQDGPVYRYTFEADAPASTTSPPSTAPPTGCAALARARAAQTCERNVRIKRLSGEAAVRRSGGPWRTLRAGDLVGVGEEVFTGVDSSLEMEFDDGSTFRLGELTQILFSTILFARDRAEVAVQLKVGELKAHVEKEQALDTNFEVSDRVAGNGVRGTTFSVFYDPATRTQITSVTEGVVEVDPTGPGLATTLVGAGREVEVTPKSISPLAAIGKAGARGGVNRARARALVLARLKRTAKRCRTRTPRSPGAVSVTGQGARWLVSVRVTGKRSGRSTWRVVAGRAAPVNRLARRLVAGCR